MGVIQIPVSRGYGVCVGGCEAGGEGRGWWEEGTCCCRGADSAVIFWGIFVGYERGSAGCTTVEFGEKHI